MPFVRRLMAVRRSAVVAVVVLLVVVAAPVVQELGPQSSSRFNFTGAIVDDGTIRLDGQLESLGLDRVVHDGHTYSDKAPAQPFLAVPFYAAARAVGAEPSSNLIIKGNLGVWWLALWFALLPAIAIVVLSYQVARPLGELPATLGAVSMAFGWMLLPYSIQLYAHLFVAALCFGAWHVLRGGSGPRRVLTAGGLVGLAILSEYQMALMAVLFGAWLLGAGRRRDLVTFAAGLLPAAGLLAVYQWSIFGHPLQTTYGAKPIHESSSTVILGWPTPRGFMEILVGSRGVALYTPVVLAAAAGLVHLARVASPHRRDARMGLAVLVTYVVLVSGWRNAWGGEEPAPRYLMPALPFLVLGAAEAWRWVLANPRWLPFLRVATIWSVANMVGPLLTPHLIPDGVTLVRAWASRLVHDDIAPTLFTLALGRIGWTLYLTVVLLAGWNLWAVVRTQVRASNTPGVDEEAPGRAPILQSDDREAPAGGVDP